MSPPQSCSFVFGVDFVVAAVVKYLHEKTTETCIRGGAQYNTAAASQAAKSSSKLNAHSGQTRTEGGRTFLRL